MSWQILILSSVAFYSCSVLFQRIVLKNDKTNPIAVSILSQVIIAALLAIYGFLIERPSLPSFIPYLLPLGVLAILYSIGYLCVLYGMQKTDAANFTIIFSFRAVITTLVSIFVLKEAFLTKHLIGAALIIMSIILVNLKGRRIAFHKGDLLALAAAVLYGLQNANDRYLLQTMNVYVYMPVGFILPTIATALMRPSGIPHIKELLQKRTFPQFFTYCFLYSLAALTFFNAMQKAPSSSQVALVSLISTVLIVILAAVFLKERDGFMKKMIGAVLSVIGAMLLV